MKTFFQNLFPLLLVGTLVFLVVLDVVSTMPFYKKDPWWTNFLIAGVIVLLIGTVEFFFLQNF